MPKYTEMKMNFTGGEISPLLSVRTDYELVGRSLKEAKNVEILPYGGIKRRGGFVPYAPITAYPIAGFSYDKCNIFNYEVDQDLKIFIIVSSLKQNDNPAIKRFGGLDFIRYDENYQIGKYVINDLIIQDKREDTSFSFDNLSNFDPNEVVFAQNGINVIMVHPEQKPILIRYDRNVNKIIIEDVELVNQPQFAFFDNYSPQSTQDTHSLIIKLDNKWIFEDENGNRSDRRSPVSRNYKIGFDGAVSNEIVFNSLSNYNPNSNNYENVIPHTALGFKLEINFNKTDFETNIFKRKTVLKDRWTGAELPIEFNIEIPVEMLDNEAEATPARLNVIMNSLKQSIYDSIYRLFFSTSNIYNDGVVMNDFIDGSQIEADYWLQIGGGDIDGKLSTIRYFFSIRNAVVSYNSTTYTLPAIGCYEIKEQNTIERGTDSISIEAGSSITYPVLNDPEPYFTAFNYLSFYKEFARLNKIKDLNNFYFEVLPYEYAIDNNTDFNIMKITFSLFNVDALEYPVITGEWVGAKYWQGEDSYIRSKKEYNANSFLEDAFSELRGWPTSAIFLENRLVLGGSKSLPNLLWASRIGDFFNFGNFEGKDDEALLNISSNTNKIKYLMGQKSLQIFTDNSEHYNPNALTTKEITLPQQSNEGCASIKPVFIDNATFFLDKNKNALRMFLYNDLEQAYKTMNMSLEAPHLIKNVISMTARQTATSNFVYMLNDDNTITVMNTIRDQEVKSFYTFESGITFKGAGVMDNKLFTAGYFNSERELILYVYDDRVELDNIYLYNRFDLEWSSTGLRAQEELPKPQNKFNVKYTVKSYPWRLPSSLDYRTQLNFYEVDTYMIGSKYNDINTLETYVDEYANSRNYPNWFNETGTYNQAGYYFNRYLGVDYDVYIVSQDITSNLGTGERMSETKRIIKAVAHCYETLGWYLTYKGKSYIIDSNRNISSNIFINGNGLFPQRTVGDKRINLSGYIKRDNIKLEQKEAFKDGVIQGYTLQIKSEV